MMTKKKVPEAKAPASTKKTHKLTDAEHTHLMQVQHDTIARLGDNYTIEYRKAIEAAFKPVFAETGRVPTESELQTICDGKLGIKTDEDLPVRAVAHPVETCSCGHCVAVRELEAMRADSPADAPELLETAAQLTKVAFRLIKLATRKAKPAKRADESGTLPMFPGVA